MLPERKVPGQSGESLFGGSVKANPSLVGVSTSVSDYSRYTDIATRSGRLRRTIFNRTLCRSKGEGEP
jgi:hypothetical protein